MTDVHSREQRSRNMSAIKGKNTSPEMVVRRLLHRMGFRYRLHGKKLPGKPDIVLPRYRTVIEVRGCFWHRHPSCKYCSTPTTRPDFWNQKLRGNVVRDKKNDELLRQAGWKVIVIWECETKNSGLLLQAINSLIIQKQDIRFAFIISTGSPDCL